MFLPSKNLHCTHYKIAFKHTSKTVLIIVISAIVVIIVIIVIVVILVIVTMCCYTRSDHVVGHAEWARHGVVGILVLIVECLINAYSARVMRSRAMSCEP